MSIAESVECLEWKALERQGKPGVVRQNGPAVKGVAVQHKATVLPVKMLG